MDRETILDAVDDVANDGAGRRGHDTNDARHEGQGPLARRLEQAFGGELALALLEQRHQRPGAGRLQIVDDDLVFRGTGIGGETAAGDHLHALLGPEAKLRHCRAPDHGLDARAVVLQREIGMAGRMRPAIAGNLAAHPDVAELVFDGALQGAGDFRDGVFGSIAAGIGKERV